MADTTDSATVPWRPLPQGVELLVRATPGARRAGVSGVAQTAEGPALAVKITEVAERGRANRAIVALLAKALGVPKSAIALKRGETARLKRFVIEGDARALVDTLKTLTGE